MYLLDVSLDTPAENLALDEALLEACSGGELPTGGILRLWESPQHFVAIGRATRVSDEVHQQACQQLGIPILRRVSGGMAIVTGPGCLMVSIVAPHAPEAGIEIDRIHRTVLGRQATALQRLGLPAAHVGTSDLAVTDPIGKLRKVSGNSLRVSRQAFLYHGTLLYDFDLSLVSRCLLAPPRAPDYRQDRSHADFIANLGIARQRLAASIADTWQVRDNLTQWPQARVTKLVEQRYARPEWNLGR